MRKLKLQVQMTVDGFIARPGGEMDWVLYNWDAGLNGYVAALTEPVGTIVLGRKLAEGFIPYWASVPEQPGADKFNNTPRVVFTRTLESCPWPNATLAKGELVDEITRLKNQPGGDIIAYGGATFVSSLVQHDLIDEYHLFINPAATGSGLSIFNHLPATRQFSLVHSRPFPCGIVVLHYTPARA